MNRFSDIDCSFKELKPVYGYRSQKLVTIEKALELIQSRIDELPYFIKIAKKYCHYPSEHGLTHDESASIYIYTMEWGEQTLYRVLNQTLRNENRHLLKVWFPYLKLFDTALNKIPTVKETVWRGIPEDIGKGFHENDTIIWWSISSCSSKVNVIKGFLGNEKNSTTFLIEALNGKKVSGYTAHESEDEIILRMGTEFRVKSNALDHPNGSYLVHLIEINDDNNHTKLALSVNQIQLSTITTNQISSTDILQHIFYDAVCFVLQTSDEKNITLAKAKGIWATSQLNQQKLNRAFEDYRNVILFLSVTKSERFQGIARLSCQSRHTNEKVVWIFQEGKKDVSNVFHIDWIPCEPLRFCNIEHLLNSLNENKPVTMSSDGQEIELDCAKALCRLFRSDLNIDIMPIVTKAISHNDNMKADKHKTNTCDQNSVLRIECRNEALAEADESNDIQLKQEESESTYDTDSIASESVADDLNDTILLRKNAIFISGLPSTMPKQLLFDTLYDEFCTVGRIKIDKQTKKPSIFLLKSKRNNAQLSGNAVITFENGKAVAEAIKKYNQMRVTSLNNARIGVKQSEMKPHALRQRQLELVLPLSNLERNQEKSENTDDTDSIAGESVVDESVAGDLNNAVLLRKNAIFISGLPSTMIEQLLFDTLWDEFSTVGSIKIDKQTKKPSISVLKSKRNNAQLSIFAEITFENGEAVAEAIKKYNQMRVTSLNNARLGVKRSEMKPGASRQRQLELVLPLSSEHL
ncbi:unnamed protein product [Adineta steineri]|uniref:Mono(ADP-ribosyl)transferase n=1 Tax=Adineta steineri TaxID=433720 RepID=A0A814MTP3_9BILA|nr:unnamed protein product [Adineta steineri]CAF1083345.1 unnamed protein product [Adineta steineri]